jgi:uncharacterized membrane-anchored protein
MQGRGGVMRLRVSKLLVLAVLCNPIAASAQSSGRPDPRQQVDQLNWSRAPQKGQIGTVAAIKLTSDLRFLGSVDTNHFLELNGSPPRKLDAYTLAPSGLDWFAVFTYDDTGHVSDNDSIDADFLLKTLKAQNAQGIEERRRLGYPVLHLEGWYIAPHYDVQTKRLEWGTKLRSESGDITINYTTRLLGRTGVTRVTLVSNPESLDADVRSFKQALGNFSYLQGQDYAEFRTGDHVAEYGLAALVVGGAAAAAAKTGAAKGLFKIFGFGALAAGAAVLGLLKRLFGRKKAA